MGHNERGTYEHVQRGLRHRVSRHDPAHLIRAADASGRARDVQELLRAALLEKRQRNLRDKRGAYAIRLEGLEKRIGIDGERAGVTRSLLRASIRFR